MSGKVLRIVDFYGEKMKIVLPEHEYFFTSALTVDVCRVMFRRHEFVDYDHDLVVEPCAGLGSFFHLCEALCRNVLYIDTFTPFKNVIEQDFLSYDMKQHMKKGQKIHVCTCFPFTQTNDKWFKFLEKTITFADSFCIVIPDTITNKELLDHIPQNFHLVEKHEAPPFSFISKEHSDFHYPSRIQLWVKKETPRQFYKRIEPMYYSYVTINDPYDFLVMYNGRNKHVIDKPDPEEIDRNRHRAIKLCGLKFTEEEKKAVYRYIYRKEKFCQKKKLADRTHLTLNDCTKYLNFWLVKYIEIYGSTLESSLKIEELDE